MAVKRTYFLVLLIAFSVQKNLVSLLQDDFAIKLDPIYDKSKVTFGRNSNTKLVIINEQNLKSISQNKNNRQYFSNKNINKSSKKLVVNEYNFKTNHNIINKDNYNSKYNRKHTNGL